MKLYSWNVNGLRACWGKGALKKLLVNHQPDIVCLQEIKAQRDQSPLEGVGDYHQFWSSSQVKKGYSGTLVLSRKQPLECQLDFTDKVNRRYDFRDQFGQTNREGRLITLEFADFFLVTVYTPNSKGDLSRLDHRFRVWDPAFLEHCRGLQRQKPLLVCGDLNVAHKPIDLARPKQNEGKHGFTQQERSGFDNLIGIGLVDTFRYFWPNRSQAYSWWSMWANSRQRNIGWRIDYWLVSNQLIPRLQSSTIHAEILGSDHCPVSLEVKP